MVRSADGATMRVTYGIGDCISAQRDLAMADVARRGAEAAAVLAAADAEERGQRRRRICVASGVVASTVARREECTLEEIELRAQVASAVVEEGVAGRRRRVTESEWGGRKVPKLRDKSGDE